MCIEHGDHLSSYCVKDGTLVCSSCLLYGSHKHHNCLLVKEAAKLHKEKLRELTPEVLQQKQKMEAALVRVEELAGEVQQSGGRLVDELDAKFNAIIEQIEERRMQLKLEIMERTQVRVEALLQQARLVQL